MPKFKCNDKSPKAVIPPQTDALIKAKGNWDGANVSWAVNTCSAELSAKELVALKKKHGTKNFNAQRAERVKALMQGGKSIIQIAHQLKKHGRGYGERMIKADHAALSPTIK